MNSDCRITTIRMMGSKSKDPMKAQLDPVLDHKAEAESDAESFHSAISSVAKPRSRCRKRPAQHRTNTTKTTEYVIQCEAEPGQPEPPRRRSTGSQATRQSGTSDPSQPPSRRSSRPSNHPGFPRRHSSMAQANRPHPLRKDSVALHRQSCLLFSSLDGVIAPSREITPLPSSFSTSPSTTRHASIVPEETLSKDGDSVRRFCASIDAKLGFEASARSRSDDAANPFASRTYTLPDHDKGASLASTRQSLTTVTPPRMSNEEAPPCSTTTILGSHDQDNNNDDLGPQRPSLNTVMSWTSTASRRAEYEKIDRAHAGLRGLLRRAAPRRLCRDGRRGFFTGDCDGASVRRFRLDVNDDVVYEDDEHDDSDDGDDDDDIDDKDNEADRIDQQSVYGEEEKGALRVVEDVHGGRRREGGNHAAKQSAKPKKKRRWLCFGS